MRHDSSSISRFSSIFTNVRKNVQLVPSIASYRVDPLEYCSRALYCTPTTPRCSAVEDCLHKDRVGHCQRVARAAARDAQEFIVLEGLLENELNWFVEREFEDFASFDGGVLLELYLFILRFHGRFVC